MINNPCAELNICRFVKEKKATERDDTVFRLNLVSSICSCLDGNTNTFLFGKIINLLLFVWMQSDLYS